MLFRSGFYNGSWIDISTPINYPIGPDGDHKLCVIGQDDAGNIQLQSDATTYQWTKDTVAPTATIGGGPTNPSSDANLNATVSGTGVVDYQYKLVSGASACTGGGYNGSWIAIATPITDAIGADGDYKLCVIGRDAADNAQTEASASQHTWTRDSTAPTATITNGPANPSNDTSLNVSVSGTGVLDYQYKIVSGASLCTGGSYNGSWIAVATAITDAIGADGDYKLCVIGRDNAANAQTEASASTYTWTKDTSEPTSGDVVLGGQTSPGPQDSNLNVDVGGTNIDSYQYKIVDQSQPCTGGGYNGTWIDASINITAATGADGDYKLCIITQDTAGNIQDESDATTIVWTKDTTPPLATIAGEPTGSSNTIVLDVTVAGTDVSHYQ